MNRIVLASAAGLFLAGAVTYAMIVSNAPAQPPVLHAMGPAPRTLPVAPRTIEPSSMGRVNFTFAPLVKRVAPAVVNVYSRSVVQTQVNPFFSDPLFSQLFGNPQMRKRVQQSLGSGVIVRSDGIIITNNHVVSGGTDIVVVLSDKREFKAKVLMADPRTDLAVLKIDTHGERLPTIPFADSDNLQVGDLVLAIGDPFGVGQTVTMGIISALARTQVSASDYQFFIQTDAAINPGNSGGALVTSDGKLAGINTAIYSRSGGSVGIGFAIPANLAKRVVEGVEAGHGLRLAWIGADGQAVTSDIAGSLGLSRPRGVLLKDVYPGGPLANAGLHSGDAVFGVDGLEVDDMQSLNYRIATHKPGDVVRMHVSQGGHTRDVSVKVALPPETPPRDLQTVGGRNPLTGAKIENLSPAVTTDLGLAMTAKGVAVVSVAPGSIAGNYGFRPGDIVRSVNGRAIHRTGDLQAALAGAGHWSMIIERGNQRLTLSVAG
jgi:serine protease Do